MMLKKTQQTLHLHTVISAGNRVGILWLSILPYGFAGIFA